MSSGKFRVHYFPSRGRAEVIRLLLADVGADWEDVPLDAAAFAAFKAAGNSTWGSLPVVEVDGKFLPQTLAVLKYIGSQHGRYPSDLEAQYHVDSVVGAAEDFRQASFKVLRPFANPTPEDIESYKNVTAPRWLGNFEKVLSENTESAYAVGADATIADFLLYDLLDNFRTFVPGVLERYPRLQAFVAAVEARDGIAAHIPARKPGWAKLE